MDDSLVHNSLSVHRIELNFEYDVFIHVCDLLQYFHEVLITLGTPNHVIIVTEFCMSIPKAVTLKCVDLLNEPLEFSKFSTYGIPVSYTGSVKIPRRSGEL